ncbi:DUF2254 family protein [Qipengyuania atrilutea]|uniref:DUF2254 domain-containing protein n=1 Tax=Qipengyuania atrilutea TaxID=2744473 RepID=A0A850H445_9SPHN|nr:DUF2254 family protein [Actirhodobacter atriluteus]NVD44962.1 DUF2254 domain-containing protein [Actirhodobacter atriluteus]
MTIKGPLKGLFGWLAHRVFATYFLVPICATIIAAPIAYLFLAADDEGLSGWVLSSDIPLVASGKAAQEYASVLTGVNAALLTLYFSITLLVLTIAAANLGVRLIDRWLDKRLIRVSLAGLCFNLVFSLVLLAAVDPDASGTGLPQGTLWISLLLFLLNLSMLTVALHDLGRTMYVDKAVSKIAEDAGEKGTQIASALPHKGTWNTSIAAKRDGYVEGIDLEELAKCFKDGTGKVHIAVAPGQHVLEGETVLRAAETDLPEKQICRAIPIGPYRSNSQGAVFQIRLLVEIAARALSPAVNDFYSAIAAADRLTSVMANQKDLWIEDGEIAVSALDNRFELAGQDFRGLFEDPMNAFRQAAADYPSVSIRMIGNLARLTRQLSEESASAGLLRYLHRLAEELAEHAKSRAQTDYDRQAIARSLDAFEGLAQASETGNA